MPAKLSPLTAESWLVSLPLGHGEPTFVSVPLGATTQRPILVALHGAGDRPEWACGGWRGATDGYPFILCPSGVGSSGPPASRVFTLDSAERTRSEIDGGLTALRATFGDHVAAGPIIVAGFSLGAVRLAAYLRESPTLSPVAVLAEGAYDALSPELARLFHDGGGRRLLLVCSSSPCKTTYERALPWLERVGVEARVSHSGREVHNLDAETVQAIRKDWPWVVRDDPRWGATYQAARAASHPAAPGSRATLSSGSIGNPGE